jgi:hypothetical protein
MDGTLTQPSYELITGSCDRTSNPRTVRVPKEVGQTCNTDHDTHIHSRSRARWLLHHALCRNGLSLQCALAAHTEEYLVSVDDTIAIAVELLHGPVGRIHILWIHLAFNQEALSEVGCQLALERTIEMEIQ